MIDWDVVLATLQLPSTAMLLLLSALLLDRANANLRGDTTLESSAGLKYCLAGLFLTLGLRQAYWTNAWTMKALDLDLAAVSYADWPYIPVLLHFVGLVFGVGIVAIAASPYLGRTAVPVTIGGLAVALITGALLAGGAR